jgi:hypothetical protein
MSLVFSAEYRVNLSSAADAARAKYPTMTASLRADGGRTQEAVLCRMDVSHERTNAELRVGAEVQCRYERRIRIVR